MNTFLEFLRWLGDVWETGNCWARWAIRISLIYLALVTIAGIIGVPWLTASCILVALAVIPFALLAQIDPLVVAASAAPERSRNILRWLATIILGEVLFGIYLVLVPVWSSRSLMPLLLVIISAMIIAGIAQPGRLRRLASVALTAILVVLTTIFLWNDQEGNVRSAVKAAADSFTKDGEWKVVRVVPDRETAVKLPYLHWFDLDPEAPIVVRNENGDEFLWNPDDTIVRHAGECKEGEMVEGIRDVPKAMIYLRACDNRIVRVGITVEPATMQAYQSTR